MTPTRPMTRTWIACCCCAWLLAGCTAKVVGDPNRPITIRAHVTVDIRELKDTATSIEDLVSQGATK